MLRAAAVQSAARSGAAAEPAYGLPSEKAITYQTEGGAVTVRDSIVRVDGDLPPRDALLIEPGAKRVDSRLVRLEHRPRSRYLHRAEVLPRHAAGVDLDDNRPLLVRLQFIAIDAGELIRYLVGDGAVSSHPEPVKDTFPVVPTAVVTPRTANLQAPR